MKDTFKIVIAEMKKQHRLSFHSYAIYFSLLLWPIIIFFNTYYTYLSFDLTKAPVFSGLISSKQSLLIFLITGFIGYNFFYSMVQSAWQMGAERQNGTLETIILSPANWLAVVYGRSLGALFQNVWMFSAFSILIIMSSRSLEVNLFLQIPIAFFILTLSATVWGGLMNVIFLFSRDAAILNNVLDDPMEFFSGVRVPIETFPVWAKMISVIFPLTHSLTIVRMFLLKTNIAWMDEAIKLSISLVLLFILTIVLLKLVEKSIRDKGNITFY